MNMNRTGMNVKKNVNGALRTLLGIITKSTVERSKLHDDVGQAEKAVFEGEVEKLFMEAEVLKAQAYKRIQEFQKR